MQLEDMPKPLLCESTAHPRADDPNRLIREELHRCLGGILAILDCQPIIIGGVDDLLHSLSVLPRPCELAATIQLI